jgi:hypothetical protein
MPLKALRPTPTIDFRPGTSSYCYPDGIYEYSDTRHEQFGEQRVGTSCALTINFVPELSAILFDAVHASPTVPRRRTT